MRDGRPAFNFMDLRRFSATLRRFEDNRNILYLLQNAKLLEKLQLSVVRGQSLVGLLSASAPTLKVLDLSVSFLWDGILRTCEELEALAGHNMLEDFKVRVVVGVDLTNSTERFRVIGTIFQKVEDVLVKPGWSALRQVSFEVRILGWNERSSEMCEALQSLPDKYFSHLSKLEYITFNYSAYIY